MTDPRQPENSPRKRGRPPKSLENLKPFSKDYQPDPENIKAGIAKAKEKRKASEIIREFLISKEIDYIVGEKKLKDGKTKKLKATMTPLEASLVYLAELAQKDSKVAIKIVELLKGGDEHDERLDVTRETHGLNPPSADEETEQDPLLDAINGVAPKAWSDDEGD